MKKLFLIRVLLRSKQGCLPFLISLEGKCVSAGRRVSAASSVGASDRSMATLPFVFSVKMEYSLCTRCFACSPVSIHDCTWIEYGVHMRRAAQECLRQQSVHTWDPWSHWGSRPPGMELEPQKPSQDPISTSAIWRLGRPWGPCDRSC